jgi:hypothetical protein
MNKFMNIAVFILSGILASGGAFAKDKAASCAKCGEMKRLESEFNALNYFNSADQDIGSTKAVKVLAYVEAFRKDYRAKKTTPEEFQALVTLVAAENPYDVETAAAAELSGIIASSAELKDRFPSALNLVVEACRKQDLAAQVENYLCQFANEKPRKPGQEATNSCPHPNDFIIDNCLTGHSSSPAK